MARLSSWMFAFTFISFDELDAAPCCVEKHFPSNRQTVLYPVQGLG